MKKIALFNVFLFVIVSANSQKTSLTDFDSNIIPTHAGLVPADVFNEIVMRDYRSLGLVSGFLPQNSVLYSIAEKKLNLNFSKFIENPNFSFARAFSYNAQISADFSDKASRSVLLGPKGVAANIEFTMGGRIFFPAKAYFARTDKNKLNTDIAAILARKTSLDGIISAHSGKFDDCCICKGDSAFKKYIKDYLDGSNPVFADFINIDTCLTRISEKIKDAEIRKLLLNARFTRKIYTWVDASINYSRPSINTLNRTAAFDQRLNTRIFNNTGVNISYNRMIKYPRETVLLRGIFKYNHSDNRATLEEIPVNYERRIETSGSNTYYEKTEKKAFDTTLLTTSPFITVGGEGYLLFNRVIGLSGLVNYTFSDDVNNSLLFNIGIILPVYDNKKTIADLKIYWQSLTRNKKVIGSRYTNEFGIQIGLPITMFTKE